MLIYTTPFKMGESASVVLGQDGFTSNTNNLSAAGMAGPAGVAADRAGNLYVADSQNCRVLRFTAPFANGMSASLVLGQPDFTTNACAATANGLYPPGGIAVDARGDLWVADGASRVVRFPAPLSNAMAADLVLGQADFTSGMANRGGPVRANTLAWGSFLTFDASGNLWVTDTENNRILEYVPPFSNGMDATLALGQVSLTSSSLSAPSATSLSRPSGLAFDTSGNLWVADNWNNRVLEFVPPFSTGQAASAVLGQQDFTTSAAGATQSGLNGPADVALARDGSLLVTDLFNNRTLLFAPPFTSGMNANLVVGQPDFSTTSSPTPTAASQALPGYVLVF